MPSTTGTCESRIKRCAVCKIDLKGRFVYIDDNIERLFGYSLEELFAKPFTGYLVESDHEVINYFLMQRNHYESVFETTRVHIVNRSGQIIPASIIVSLSFAAGNPVNFQIIITPDKTPDKVAEPSTTVTESDLTDSLAACADPADLGEHLGMIKDYLGGDNIVLYELTGTQLKVVGTTYHEIETIPDITDLHRRVARSGDEYRVTDQQSVQRAIENEGSAPNEFVVRLTGSGDSMYVLRIVFTADDDIGSSTVHVKASDVIDLLKSQFERRATQTRGVLLHSDIFTRLGIEAITFDAQRNINREIEPAGELISQAHGARTIDELIASLSSHNDARVLSRLRAFCSAPIDEIQHTQLNLPVTSISGRPVRMIVIRPWADMSGLIFAMPVEALSTEYSGQQIPDELIVALLDELASNLKVAGKFSDELCHQYYNQLTGEGNFRLLCLKDCLDRSGADLDAFVTMLNDVTGPPAMHLADLNLMFNQIHQRLSTAFPQVRLNCKYPNLPKVVTDAGKLNSALYAVLASFVPFARTADVTLKVGVNSESRKHQIIVESPDCAVDPELIRKLNDFISASPAEALRMFPPANASLHMARILLRALDAVANLELNDEARVSLVVTLPVLPAMEEDK